MESWRMGNGHEGPGSGIRSSGCSKMACGLDIQVMKILLISSLLLTSTLLAGESSLTVTYQPLDGLGSGEVQVCRVVCHDWYSHSGQPTAINLISARNVPPTNNPKQATDDLNLASACGIHLSCGDIAQVEGLFLDATQFKVSAGRGYKREDIIRASLECLRRCLPEKLRNTALRLQASQQDAEWLSKIVSEFNKHDRSKVFYSSPK